MKTGGIRGMTTYNRQVLYKLDTENVTEVDADTFCPECGVPWKQGASYGHNFCCGCIICGYSYANMSVTKE